MWRYVFKNASILCELTNYKRETALIHKIINLKQFESTLSGILQIIQNTNKSPDKDLEGITITTNVNFIIYQQTVMYIKYGILVN